MLSYELQYLRAHRAGSAFLVAASCWCYHEFTNLISAVLRGCYESLLSTPNERKKILSLVAHVLRVCICRVWRWEVRFFSGAAVAPAVLQVLALLRVAGGLWLFPRPRSDSVHRLQQRRLTLQGHGEISKSAAASRRKLLTLSFAHAVSTITQPKAGPKLSFYNWNQLLAHGCVCLDAESLVYYLLFFF